mgnify:CR=1 FL=1
MRRKSKFIMILFVCMVAMLAGCGQSKKEPDDYATNNVKSEKTDSAKKTSEGIAKDKIKVGVVHLSDPAEGSGYTYTHELGIQGMQKNLGLSDEQIVRKNNVDDTDALATQKAIQEQYYLRYKLGLHGCDGTDGRRVSGHLFLPWNRL